MADEHLDRTDRLVTRLGEEGDRNLRRVDRVYRQMARHHLIPIRAPRGEIASALDILRDCRHGCRLTAGHGLGIFLQGVGFVIPAESHRVLGVYTRQSRNGGTVSPLFPHRAFEPGIQNRDGGGNIQRALVVFLVVLFRSATARTAA